ncbi:hypothetical protein FA95DRAFT_1559102 [Auriscalpium vulgare]|uniref:Uncharacterized protein n=1 Tax=Auriscalpium vulgare TaxID=40419 RepID=A0ACB8RTD5_9AGAM|nr:hypothetical protein FA95DRAFT_1559102 [Auriscalpium vulgare]
MSDPSTEEGRKKGVFTVHSSIIIEAPRSTVWGVLLDFASYKEWNPFVRSQIAYDHSKTPLVHTQSLAVGHTLRMDVHIPPTMDDKVSSQHSDEIVTVVDHEACRIGWRYQPPALLSYGLHCERIQALSELEDGRTHYETWETFGGPVAYVLRATMEKDLRKSFDAMAAGLKVRSENSEPRETPEEGDSRRT